VTIPSVTNCGQYYSCGNVASGQRHELQECAYPKLYSTVDNTCKDFSQVQCGQRFEPVEPCTDIFYITIISNYMSGFFLHIIKEVSRSPWLIGIESDKLFAASKEPGKHAHLSMQYGQVLLCFYFHLVIPKRLIRDCVKMEAGRVNEKKIRIWRVK
jgi:hypothetical protein